MLHTVLYFSSRSGALAIRQHSISLLKGIKHKPTAAMETSIAGTGNNALTMNGRVQSMRSLDSDGTAYSMYHDAKEVADEESSEQSMTHEEIRRKKNLHSEHCLPRARQRCGDFVNNTKVQLFIVGLICINAIMMAIATFDFVTDNSKVERCL